jgi:type IV secretory pathway VirD2 relaxase
MIKTRIAQQIHARDAAKDPDRIARMAGGRRREPNVAGKLARRLGGARRFSSPGSRRKGGHRGAGTSTFAARGRPQRVIVKVHSSRHRPNPSGRGRSSLARHVTYLGRDSASLEGGRGVFYSAVEQAVEARQVTREWEQDRHHFRVIISPEKAAEIADLRGYVREVMARMERDLGTRLQWIGINHYNTDNIHSHVLIRGVRDDGKDLVIKRSYIAHGIRDRAVEVATELLGPRSIEEVRNVRAKEVQSERFTSLDRLIERSTRDGIFDVTPKRRIGINAADRELVIARLQTLERMGLARKTRGTIWHIEPQFKHRLMELGSRNDIIKRLYSKLGTEAGQVSRMDMRGQNAQAVTGVVVAKGAVDEIGEDRFVVLRDQRKVLHYARVWDNPSYQKLNVGDRAEVGRGTLERRALAAELIAVAEANAGVYGRAEHESQLRKSPHPVKPSDIARRVERGAQMAHSLAGKTDSGVTQDSGSSNYRIERSKLERLIDRQGRHGVTDVRRLDAQRTAHWSVGRNMGVER